MKDPQHGRFMRLAKEVVRELGEDPDVVPSSLGEFVEARRSTREPDSAEAVDADRYLLYAGLVPLIQGFVEAFEQLPAERFDVLDVDFHWAILAELMEDQALYGLGVRALPPGSSGRQDREQLLREYGIELPKRDGALVGSERFNALLGIVEQAGDDVIDRLLRPKNMPTGYQHLAAAVDEIRSVQYDMHGTASLQSLPVLMRAGLLTSLTMTVRFAEALPRILLANGNLTEDDLSPARRRETVEVLRDTLLTSPFFKTLAARPLPQFDAIADALAGCNDGCTRQLDPSGAVPAGVEAPAHTFANQQWELRSLDQSIGDFAYRHANFVPWDVAGFSATSRDGRVRVDLAPALQELGASVDVGDRSPLGCPALFGGLVRRVSAVVANLAADRGLWDHQLGEMWRDLDLDTPDVDAPDVDTDKLATTSSRTVRRRARMRQGPVTEPAPERRGATPAEPTSTRSPQVRSLRLDNGPSIDL
jgi:hypothetical protein